MIIYKEGQTYKIGTPTSTYNDFSFSQDEQVMGMFGEQDDWGIVRIGMVV